MRSIIVPSAYLVTFALAFVSTVVCYVIWLATTVYIAFGPATRKIPVWTERTEVDTSSESSQH